MLVDGELRRAGACVLLCLGLAAASACSGPQPQTAAPPVQPAVSVSATPPRTIGGTAFYLDSKGAILEVHAVRGGSDTPVSIVADTGPCPSNTAVMSPDGGQIAWVATTDPMGRGNLTVSDLHSGSRRTLPATVSCLGSTSLSWLSPAKIAITPPDQARRQVLLNPTTGEPLGDQVPGGWSADGMWVATTDSGDNPIVMPKGSPGAARRYTYTPPAGEAEHYDGWSARGVSNDGRYVSVGWDGTDPSRGLGSFAVVDTVTSKVVNLPVTGAVSSIHFLADGTVLVRIDGGKLTLLDQRFTVLAQTTEPASVRDLSLLSYVTP